MGQAPDSHSSPQERMGGDTVPLGEEDLPGAIYRCRHADPEGLLYLSAGIEPLTGHPPGVWLSGKSQFHHRICVEDRARVAESIASAIEANAPWQVEYRILHTQFGERWVAERGHIVERCRDGSIIVGGFIYDITEHKHTELALRSTQSQYQALVMHMRTGLVVHDADTRILYSNPAAREFLALTEDQLFGKVAFDPGWQFLRGDGSVMPHEEYPAIWVARHQSPLHQQQVGVIHHAGADIRWGLVEAYPEFEQSALKRIIVTFIDITTQKQAEQALEKLNDQLEQKVVDRTAALLRANQELERAMNQLVQSEKLASLGALVAGVAHELNTPLGNALVVVTSLQDQLGILKQDLERNLLSKTSLQNALVDIESGVQLVQQSSQRAADLVASFKQVAVDQASVRRRKFSVQALIDDVIQSMSPMFRQQPVRFDLDIAPDLEMDSYPGPLEQVLTNLIQNSLVHGFADSGSESPRIAITVDVSDGVARFDYRDNGKGMTPDVRAHAFDPFFTTRLGQGGSGLGLYIVYNQITSLLHGKVTLMSQPGQGCQFVLEVPAMAT